MEGKEKGEEREWYEKEEIWRKKTGRETMEIILILNPNIGHVLNL